MLLAAAPFGWLAFAAFLYAGIRARRPTWLLASIVYFVAFWGATMVGSIEASEAMTDAAGVLILFGWPASFLHALLSTPRYLRARDRLAGGPIASPYPLGPPGTPPPAPPMPPPASGAPAAGPPVAREPIAVPGWNQGWGGGRFRFWMLAVFDVLLVVGGLLFLLSDVRVAIVMLLFGVGTAFTLPLFVTWKRSGSLTVAPTPDRPGRVGLHFPYSRGRLRTHVFGLIFMAIACGAFAVVAGDLESTVAGVIGCAVLGLNAIRILTRPGAPPYVALTEEGIVARIGGGSTFVPWIAMTDVVPVEINMRSAREQFVGINVSDRSLVEVSGWGRTLMRVNRWIAADLSYTTRGLDVDPALLYYAAHYYWRHPEPRGELSTQAAVDRVTRLDLFDGSSGTAAGTPPA